MFDARLWPLGVALTLGVALASPGSANRIASTTERLNADIQALLAQGPRVTGSPAVEKAALYLAEQYRQAGYTVTFQPFAFERFVDRGSSLKTETVLAGRALQGSIAGRRTGRLIVVPGVGEKTDFAKVNVRDAIAIVRRGQIPFLAKARNASAAGALALVVVNSKPEPLSGNLGGEVAIPVLALAGKQGEPLLEKPPAAPVELEVRTEVQSLTGRNLIAHLPGVETPQLLLGAHLDSVEGAPGANDNASGSAVILETARRLADTPLGRRSWFVHFDAEEEGLIGSRHFVRSAAKPLLTGLRAMLNFDMVGVGDKLYLGGTPELVALARRQATDLAPLARGDGASDHASFQAANVPVLFFYRGQDPNYHQPGDRIADPALLDATVTAARRTAEALLEVATPESPSG